MATSSDLIPSEQNFALFEGSSIKQFIIEQLNKGGIYVDQKYLGSNLNAFIDIIAVMLQQILFHYNNTASESTFATATLYENMNKLVSLFNYKPTGKQTSILPIKYNINMVSSTREAGTYIIPRYSFINYNNSFVLKEDLSFTFQSNKNISIDDILFQGTLTESDPYIFNGEDFEIITLIDTNIKTTSGKFISDNFFDVYVQEPNGKWTQYEKVNSLFEYSGTSKVFECRINENYNYDFKFGNNINGYKPVEGSKVIIFYLISDGTKAEVGDDVISNAQLYLYNSTAFKEIIMDTTTGIFSTLPNYINSEDIKYISVNNTGRSTPVSTVESVETMRNNVPKIFAAQSRLLTKQDYIAYIKKLFNNFVKDCYIFNNSDYTGSYLKYFYNIGLDSPNIDTRVLLNQVTFQSSCAFNNIYVVLLPLINTIIDDKVPNYVNTNLKQYILEQLEPYKDIAHNITPIDPIYKAISFGIERTERNTLPEHFDDVKLVLIRDRYSNFSTEYIKAQAESIFKNYFNNVKLGDEINISQILGELVQISGVIDCYMTDGDTTNNKLTFIVWNPLYEEADFTITSQNITLAPYMYQYFYDLKNINSKITIINE